VSSDICPRCESRLEAGDLRCPVCLLGAPVEATERPRLQVEILRCSGCGAAVSYTIRARAPACAFCGSTLEVEVSEDPPEQIEHYLPFTVDRRAAENAFRRWLGGLGWFRPSDLKSASTVESLGSLWWVGWVCSAAAVVSWTADSDADARRADWAPHAGQIELPLGGLVVSGSRGLSSAETSALTPSYDLETARDRAVGGDRSAAVEQFDLLRSAARRHVRVMIERLVEARLTNGIIPGQRFRNLRTAIALRRLRTRRCAFPSWVLAYRHRGRLYRVVISGQDGGCVMGTAPYSVLRIAAAVAGGVVAAGLAVALLIALLS
jgi:hypothetical protein